MHAKKMFCNFFIVKKLLAQKNFFNVKKSLVLTESEKKYKKRYGQSQITVSRILHEGNYVKTMQILA